MSGETDHYNAPASREERWKLIVEHLENERLLSRLCYEIGHRYIRVADCSTGICIQCGFLAQKGLQRVGSASSGTHYYRELHAGKQCIFCHVKLDWSHRHSHRGLTGKNVACSGECRDQYILSFKSTPEGSTRVPPINWSFAMFRQYALRRDNHTCQECGEIQDLEVHHILPRAEGGSDHPENLITLCQKDHAKKRNKRYHAQMSAIAKCKSLESFG